MSDSLRLLEPQGGILDFKWQGWSNGGKNQNPKTSVGLPTKPQKSLDQKLTPQKSHVRFPSLKHFTTMNLQIVLNTLKNLYLNQYLSNFSSKKKTLKGKYQTPQKTSIISITWNLEYTPGIGVSCQLTSMLLFKNTECSTNICWEKEMLLRREVSGRPAACHTAPG